MKNIEKFKKLYEVSSPVQSITCNTTDFMVFKNEPSIRFCNSLEHIKELPTGSDNIIQKMHSFMNQNPYFWMIPLKTAKENIFGFVIKSYTCKQYRNIYNSEHIACFYGWQKFKDFKKNYPIILCEGTKDCIILQKIYPYSLACLTSGLSGIDDFNVITNLTNKVILCYDNDSVGKASVERDLKKLSSLGCRVNTAFYNSKDPGDLWNNQVGFNLLKNSIINIIKSY